jgi:hypothetical protein
LNLNGAANGLKIIKYDEGNDDNINSEAEDKVVENVLSNLKTKKMYLCKELPFVCELLEIDLSNSNRRFTGIHK